MKITVAAVNPRHTPGPASSGTVARHGAECWPGMLRNHGPASSGIRNPVRETAQGLALRPLAVRKDLGGGYPGDGALADGVGCDQGEDADRDQAQMTREQRPGHEIQR